MDLRDYLRVLRKGWPLILAFVVLGLAAGIGITLATTQVYQADAELIVSTAQNANAADLAQGNTFVQAQVQSYVSLADSPSVTGPVARAYNQGRTTGRITSNDLADKITADAPLNKVLINLHVTDHDPRTAAVLANAVAQRFATYVENSQRVDGSANSAVKLVVYDPAQIPGSPIKPNKPLNIGLGFVVGLLVGVGIVVLRDVLDNSVKSAADFEQYGVPAMGVVPFDKRTASSPVAFRADPNSARSEAYRQIRTNLQFVDVDNPPRIISVTSAVPGEGKSTTALNLAAALAEAGSRVCLIEADLRRPSLGRALGIVADVGFTTALIGKAPVEDVLQNAGHNLAVLTSGPIPPNPSELLITDHARNLIEQVAAHVDFVVIDTPPLLPVTDGATVATLADATMLVARTGKTSHEQAARSVDALEKVGKRPVGVVLNMVTRSRGAYSYEYGYYYTSDRPTRRLGRGENPAPAAPTLTADESTDPVAPSVGLNGYRPAHAGSPAAGPGAPTSAAGSAPAAESTAPAGSSDWSPVDPVTSADTAGSRADSEDTGPLVPVAEPAGATNGHRSEAGDEAPRFRLEPPDVESMSPGTDDATDDAADPYASPAQDDPARDDPAQNTPAPGTPVDEADQLLGEAGNGGAASGQGTWPPPEASNGTAAERRINGERRNRRSRTQR